MAGDQTTARSEKRDAAARGILIPEANDKVIQRLSHVTIWVLNQDEAYDFYVNKLGFKVNTDAKMDNGFRWLTVTPPAQPDLEIVLMPADPGPMMDQETCDALRTLVKKGVLGAGVFATGDCRKTYDELKAKGVDPSLVNSFLYRDYGLDFYGNGIAASPNFLKEHPDAVKAFIRASISHQFS